MKNYNFIISILAGIVFSALLYFPVFLHLDYLTIHPWDEALFAIRAYYIAETGKVIDNFNQIEGLTELTNSKPALFSYIQAGFMKFFGYGPLALRLPVAISYLFMCMLFIFVSRNSFKNYFPGIFASLVLVTTPGMADHHMGRFGDHDIPFALLLFGMIYTFYAYLKEQKNATIIIFCLLTVVAFYIKSIMVFIVFPGFVVYAISQNKFSFLLKNFKTYIALTVISIPPFIELASNSAHLENINRISETVQHGGSIFYYFNYFIFEGMLMPWFLFLPIGLIFIKKSKLIKLMYLQFGLIVLFLSLAQTKLYWYSSPVFPLLAFISGFTFYQLLKYGVQFLPEKSFFSGWIFMSTICALVFIIPYTKTLKTVYHPKEEYITNQSIRVLEKSRKIFDEIGSYTIIHNNDYTPQLEYYMLVYNKHYGVEVNRTDSLHPIRKAEYVICNNHDFLYQIEPFFEYEKLLGYEQASLYRLNIN